MNRTLVSNTNLSHYRIVSKIGAGGMGEVFLATDTKLKRKVALKLLPAEFTDDKQRLRRFEQEAQTASALNHPNIITIYEIGAEAGLKFIATEFIEGQTLRQKLRQGRLPLSETLDIAQQVTSALVAAHQAGIVHRDLKPENIMIRPDGLVKVLDFGLAKMTALDADSIDDEANTMVMGVTQPGMILGTLLYMSPEQLQSESLDARSDIFSLGVIFYEMLAGDHPFRDKSAAITMSRIMLGDPIATEQFHAQVSPELQALLSRMLCKDKTARYQNAQDLLTDLRQLPAKLSANTAQADAIPTKQFSAITAKGNLDEGILSLARRHQWAVLASALALILLVIAIGWFVSTERLDSLAVLPFSYVSSDPQVMANPDREYLSDGLTESIINNLSQLTSLKVIARSSVFRYKGKDLDVQATGRELNVRAVLVGQIKQEGDELRITVELMDVQRNSQIWGDTYQRKTADIQTVQSEIARTVSEKLRLKLTGAEQTQMAKTYTGSGEAYQAYLKGRYHWNKRSDEGFKQATIFFQEAIDKDPSYALAYTGLADCYTLRSDYGFLAPKEGYALAKGAVTLALKYDESLAEAHTSLASIKAVTDWDWQGAENEYRRAIELNPNYPTAHHWYAAQLLLQGRLDQALQEIRKAQQLDPVSFGINKDFAVILLYARDYDRALEQCRRTLEIEPHNGAMSTYIAQIYELKQQYPEATAELEKASAAAPQDSEITYALGQAYALIGRKDEALKILSELNQPAKQNVFLPKEAAYLSALLGEKEQAVAILQKAAEDHYLPVAEVKMDPRLAELRKDTRIVELLQKIGLSQ